ncbi:MAG: HD domain-containing protein [Thermoplasmata archaeon]|nr:HD domain-containing protein [Thermoplasmata archaeon]
MKYVKDLVDGESVDILLAVRKKLGLREYRSKFGKYFVLEAGDKTGSILVKYWGSDEKITEELYQSIKEGDVIEVKGTYQKDNTPYISVDSEYEDLEIVKNYSPERFVPKTENISRTMDEIYRIIEKVEDVHLSKLLDSFFSDENFVEEFQNAPGSSSGPYAYIGGLAEHTLNVSKLCDRISEIYSLNRDLLLTAAILHDIGKIEAYEVDTSIKTRDSAKLLGHTVLSYNMVEAKIREIVDFPQTLKGQLLHAIISHHSPIVDNVPQRIRTREAYILFYANMLDNSLKEFEMEGEEWAYSRRMGREIYLGLEQE